MPLFRCCGFLLWRSRGKANVLRVENRLKSNDAAHLEVAPKKSAHDFGVPYALTIDPDSSTRPTYGGGLYFPLHVFIDAKGIVRMYHPGEMSASDIETAIAHILK